MDRAKISSIQLNRGAHKPLPPADEVIKQERPSPLLVQTDMAIFSVDGDVDRKRLRHSLFGLALTANKSIT
jgi:hypothetical protein